MFLNKIDFLFYLINMRLKSFKYSYLLKFKGVEEAEKFVQEVAYKWSEYTINTIGIDLEVTGLENIPDEPCVFIGNHSSILDIPIILYTTNKKIGFVAKKETLKFPFLGYWITRSGSVALDRENPRAALQTINDGIANISRGYNMCIFPEGTRSKTGSVGDFKKGSMKLATKSKSKIIPVSIDRASRAFEDNRKFTPCKIKVVYGEVIDTNLLSKEEEKNLADNLRNIIITNIS